MASPPGEGELSPCWCTLEKFSAELLKQVPPEAQRKACIEKFRAGVVKELETLARTMTEETGKPIKMSRNELNGLLLGGTYSNAVAPTAFSVGISADRPPLLL